MTQAQAYKLSESTDPFVRDIYKLVASRAQFHEHVAGDEVPSISLSAHDIDDLAAIQYEHVQARHIDNSISFVTPQEAFDKELMQIAGDNIINPATRVGTYIDPQIYTHNTVPIMMGPAEGSLLYSNGGLPAEILDRKSRAMVVRGATFHTFDDKFWNGDKIQRLEEAADSTGFNDAIMDGVLNAFVYGGGIIYPVFTTDSNAMLSRSLDRLSLEPGCVSRWVTTDRWNVTIVPSYDVTAADYLYPKRLFIPIASLTVDTSRVALLKPKRMPYWPALYNLGWSPADATGWLRSYFGYKITCMSVPVMAQQISLILYRMPLDGLNATIGPDNVKKLMQINEEQMANWSSLSPKAINMVGEVEVVDRTYTGIDMLFQAMKGDLASSCGIPEPALWHTPNKGFSDNTTEALLKQSNTLMLQQRDLQKSLTPCTAALVAHVFGTDSEEWKQRHLVRMTFDKPLPATETDLAESGARFAASIASLSQAGVSPDLAVKLMSSFTPTLRVNKELIDSIKSSYDEAQKNNMLNAGGMGAGSFSKAGNAGRNAGSGQKSNSSANKVSTR